jgi:subtilase family serine protease
MGENYATLIAATPRTVDYYPATLVSSSATTTSGATVTLQATIANSGNMIPTARAAAVRFYEGDPEKGGAVIGEDQIVSLPGCGYWQSAEVIWPEVSPGTYTLFVEVDANGTVPESDETNNILSVEVIIPAHISGGE